MIGLLSIFKSVSGAWWIKPLAYMLIIAAIFGAGWKFGSDLEEREWLAKEAVRLQEEALQREKEAQRLADITREGQEAARREAELAQKYRDERDAARAKAREASKRLEELLAANPGAGNGVKLPSDIVNLLNESARQANGGKK